MSGLWERCESCGGSGTLPFGAGLCQACGGSGRLRLCPEGAERDAMSEGEFWDHVFQQEQPEFDPPEVLEGELLPLEEEPCEVCGSSGACAYDSEGRALIHATGTDAE